MHRNESRLRNFLPSRVKCIAPQAKPDSLNSPTIAGETLARSAHTFIVSAHCQRKSRKRSALSGLKAAHFFRCALRVESVGVGQPQLNALLSVRIVVKTVYFVSTELFVRLKWLTTVVALKRMRRLISPNVAPDFRICDFFWLRSHDHSLTRLKINASFEFWSSTFLLGLFNFSNHCHSVILTSFARWLGCSPSRCKANYRDGKYRRIACFFNAAQRLCQPLIF